MSNDKNLGNLNTETDEDEYKQDEPKSMFLKTIIYQSEIEVIKKLEKDLKVKFHVINLKSHNFLNFKAYIEIREFHVISLTLRYLNITEIPEEITQLKYLQSLDLSQNPNIEFPTFLKNMVHLARLTISMYKFEFQDDSINEIRSSGIEVINQPLIQDLNSLKNSSNYLGLIGSLIIVTIIYYLNIFFEFFIVLAISLLIFLEIFIVDTLIKYFIGKEIPRELWSQNLDAEDLKTLVNLQEILNIQIKLYPKNFEFLSYTMWYKNYAIINKKNIIILNLGNFALIKIPEIVKNFKNLKKIYFPRDNFSKVPEWIMEMQSINVIDCRHIRLIEIPEDFQNLTRELKIKLFIDLRRKKISNSSIFGKIKTYHISTRTKIWGMIDLILSIAIVFDIFFHLGSIMIYFIIISIAIIRMSDFLIWKKLGNKSLKNELNFYENVK